VISPRGLPPHNWWLCLVVMRHSCYVIIAIAMHIGSTAAQAVVTEFINKSAWQSAVGEHATITFQGFPEHTLITNQFTSLGVLFADGTDRVLFNDSLLNDGIGLRSSDLIYGTIRLEFSQPMTAVGSDFLGGIDILLYNQGTLFYDSSDFDTVQSRFGGVISTIPFDTAVIRDPSNGVVVIDDLFFGPAVPGPGALGLLGMAALIHRRRRS